jgi:prepilin-type N-terminal cleavage/methylation domain-containing protein
MGCEDSLEDLRSTCMKRRAFTLVELLVVIAIIAVLLAILMPTLSTVKTIAKRLQCAKKLSGIGRAYNMYVDQYDTKLPLLENYADAVPTIQSTYLLSRNGTYRHLGCLYGAGFIDSGQTFFCPAVEGWYGEPSQIGQNGGSYLGAVHATTGKFADCGTGVSQPNQGWKASRGYCYWPLSKQYAKQTDLNRITSEENRSRYNVGLPLNATKVNELMMNRPIVTDNKFHSTKTSGWLIDCLYPDGHVTYQSQPKGDGLNGSSPAVSGKWGMHSMNENCQFTGDICNGTNIISDIEKPNNLGTGVTPTQFSFALQP